MIESNLVQDIRALKTLPNSWAIKNFNEVVSDNSGGNKKLVKSKFLQSGKIAVVDQGKEMIAGYFNDLNYLVKTNPPYIVFGDHTRIFKYIDFPFVMGADGTKVLQPIEENCSTKYLFYFFQSIKVPNTGYNRHFKYLKKLKVPLPPLPEQKRIAAILDAADALRQKDQQLIDHYKQLSQSLFLEMFGDPGINPKGWKKVQIGNIFKLASGKGLTAKEMDKSGNFPVYGGNGINGYHSSYMFEIPQLIIGRVGAYCGVVHITKSQSWITDNALYVKENHIDFNIKFMAKLLEFTNLNQYASQAGQPLVSGNRLHPVEIILPPLHQQKEFELRLNKISKQKEIVISNQKKSNDLFNCLLQKAFTGELTSA